VKAIIFALKFASSFNAKPLSGAKEMVIKYGKPSEEGSREKQLKWKYKELEFSMAYALEGMSMMSLTKREVIQQLIQTAVGYYNSERLLAREKDIEAKPGDIDAAQATDHIYSKVVGALKQQATSTLYDLLALSDNKILDVTDKMEVRIKVVQKDGQKPTFTFTIGRVTNTELDAKVFSIEVIDFTPLVGFTYKK